MAKVAFLGLGVMGFPMAGHIAAAGHDVTVYNRTASKAESWVAKHGGAMAATPALAAAGADFVFACVGDDPDALAAALLAASQTGDQMRQMVARAQQRLQRDFNAATQSQKLQQYLLGNVTADAAASDYSVM